jgi:hypothetical protein
MLQFILRRLGVMALTMFCLTLVVFFLVNLEPNLKKLAISQTRMRALRRSTRQLAAAQRLPDNFFVRYGQWLGVVKSSRMSIPPPARSSPRFRYCDEPAEPVLFRHPAGRFRLLDQVQDDGRVKPGRRSKGHRHPDVLGHGGDGA